MTVTTTTPAGTSASSATLGGGQKDFWDIVGGMLPGAAQMVAPSVGIDPRIAGQTVSQVLSIFGIGGGGKAFSATIPKDQALAQLQQVVGPHLSDRAFATALGKWMEAAIEPVQAHKEGKDYQPSVDLNKSWFDDATSWLGDQVSKVDWSQVAQVGMRALPVAISLL
jgi:hypothetical protein